MDLGVLRRPEAHRLAALPLIFIAGAILVSGLSLGGCGGGSETTTSKLVDSTTVSTTATTLATATSEVTISIPETTTTEAETTTTTEALSNAEILLPNGNVRVMGFIDKVWESGGKRHISIDFAQMLTGEEARQAAIAAGDLAPDQELDNDYYIVNDNPRKREFVVAGSASVATSTFGGGMDKPATWSQLKSFWSASPPTGGEHLRDMPWWIERKGTVVISIAEQYLP
jgi:hypothetical protein